MAILSNVFTTAKFLLLNASRRAVFSSLKTPSYHFLKNPVFKEFARNSWFSTSTIKWNENREVLQNEKELKEYLVGEENSEELPGVPEEGTNWQTSFAGLSEKPFSKEISDVLLAPVSSQDIEIKPDGILYLPEIKYRRILNRAFGPGGWGLAPRGKTTVTPKSVSREYALVCHGRLVSVARGEQVYFDPSNIPTATEGCKSNALMRCCKDLGIASELWDPRFIQAFKKQHCSEIMVENISTRKRRKLWRRKEDRFSYPYKEM